MWCSYRFRKEKMDSKFLVEWGQKWSQLIRLHNSWINYIWSKNWWIKSFNNASRRWKLVLRSVKILLTAFNPEILSILGNILIISKVTNLQSDVNVLLLFKLSIIDYRSFNYVIIYIYIYIYLRETLQILTRVFDWLYFTHCFTFSSIDHLLRLYAWFFILFHFI